MRAAWTTGLWTAATAAAVAPACLLPFSAPDLFWQLSAARRMRELGAIPREDWLSATRSGEAWTSCEWAAHWLYGLVFSAGAFQALFAFKALLFAGVGAAVALSLRLYGAPPAAVAAGLAVWAAASLPAANLRPEQFSLLAFALLFYGLERRRLRGGPARPLAAGLFFCAWANFHPGFAYGLVLLGIYAAAESLTWKPRAGLWPALAAALLGTLATPFGPSTYAVIWEHARDLPVLARHLTEWEPPRLANPWARPFWIMLAAGFGAVLVHAVRRRALPLAPSAVLLYFGASALRHNRFTAYYMVVAVPLLLHLLGQAGLRLPPRLKAWAAAALGGTAVAWAAWSGASLGLGQRVFNDRSVPREAAEYLSARRAALGGKTLYNPWNWGGYLGWRLYPDYRVFQDGRYLFHGLLEENARAMASPRLWADFLDRRGIELVLVPRAPAEYFPPERWRLLYQDPKASIVLRR